MAAHHGGAESEARAALRAGSGLGVHLNELRGSAHAADGYGLSVTRFAASGRGWATAVIGGAMGVRQDFYAPLARFLAANGVHALTFDYAAWARRAAVPSRRWMPA